MTDEPATLFDQDPLTEAEVAKQMAKIRPAARHGQPSSAWEAALAITGNAETLRWKVLDLFAIDNGEGGWTNLEIEYRLQLQRPTGSNRRLELEQHGLVEQVPGQKRRMGDSQPAQVYRITPLGRAVHRHHMEER